MRCRRTYVLKNKWTHIARHALMSCPQYKKICKTIKKNTIDLEMYRAVILIINYYNLVENLTKEIDIEFLCSNMFYILASDWYNKKL